ncbi:uridylate kinase [Spirochaetia bacterium]|nr:uridylate kinase [Spirochaetia bacterium]
MIIVISLGGSIVAPDTVDKEYLIALYKMAENLLLKNNNLKFIFVVGGGGPARAWQNSYVSVTESVMRNDIHINKNEQSDWIGIMATRLNAQLVKAIFGEWCPQDVIVDPTKEIKFTGRVMVAAGWKPGFSSDNDAVLLAEKFKAGTVINLSNIEKVYSADPKKDPSAKPIDNISWKEFRLLVGDEWTPGKNVPFDPVASGRAEKSGIQVICAAGKDLSNLEKIISGKDFIGTTIS